MSTLMARLNGSGLVGLALGLGMTLAACGGAPAATATLTRLASATPNGAVSVTPRPSATVRPRQEPAASATTTPAKRATLEATYSPRVTASVRPPIKRVFSPDGNFYIAFFANSTGLYRTSDQVPISQDPVHYAVEFSTAVVWAPNSQVAITSDYQQVYLWHSDGTPPVRLDLRQAEYFHFTWSPDSRYLAAAEADFDAETMAFVIIQPDGHVTQTSDGGIRPMDYIAEVRWINGDIFEATASAGLCCVQFVYFEASTGAELRHWLDTFEQSQGPSDSPDGAWQVTDSSYRVWEGEPYASHQHYEHFYEVHRWATAATYTLYGGAEQYVEWMGWTADSATFYLISRPTEAEAIAADSLPFGLLALDPATRETRMVFEQAVFAALSDDEGLACVAFPARRADGGLGLEVGVFDLAAGTLAGRTSLADEISYPWPASHWGGPNEWAAGALAACGW